MFLTRVMSSVVLVVVILLMGITGGRLLLSFMFLISLIGLYEFYKATGVRTDERKPNILEITGILSTVVYYGIAFIFPFDATYMFFAIVLSFFMYMGVYVFTFPRYAFDRITHAFFGFVYVPVLLSCVYFTRELENGIYKIWIIFIASWICDTFAYLTGMLIGKHKLAPVLSPKKSVEGAVGGVIGAALVAALYSCFFVKKMLINGDAATLASVIICSVGAVVSQIGDLAASAIKRNHDIKDYGSLIPGHGGILDRFDSVIFTAPMIFFLFAIFK